VPKAGRVSGAEVAVELGAPARVVAAVQRRSDEQPCERGVEPAGIVDITVLDQVGHCEEKLEGEDAIRRCSEEHDCGQTQR
jgi:hypothetical protein